MIRVNLLPGSKRDTRRTAAPGGGASGGRESMWLFVLLGTIILHSLVLLGLYVVKKNELTGVENTNKGIQANIDAIKREITDHPKIKERLKQLKDREDSIDKLQLWRFPTS
jgi:Tfp pilus assembly protein PilN